MTVVKLVAWKKGAVTVTKTKVAGLIVATGLNEHGSTVDPLTVLGNMTIVKRVVLTYQLAGISPIIVITGMDGLSVERHLALYGAVFFRVEDNQKVNFQADIMPALGYAAEKGEVVVVTSVECPLFQTETVRHLIRSPGEAKFLACDGRRGYPFLLPSAPLLKITPETSFASWETLIAHLDCSKQTCLVDDHGISCVVSDHERCEGILDEHNKQMLHPYVRLDIDYPTRIFDPRTKILLMMIKDTNSVKTACKRTALSIGKAWEMINALERALDYPVVNRRQGGRRGGRTSLTPEGEEYLRKYILLEGRVQDYAGEEFKKLFLQDERPPTRGAAQQNI